MATRNARGTATEQQQWVYNAVTTFTAGHIYGITLDDLENGGTVSESATLPATLTSVADAAAYVISVMAASSKALFQGIAFSQDSPASGRINLKARIAGRPFNVNAYTATTGAWSAAQTVVRASSGPNDMKCAANYEENAVPVAADDIILHGSTTFLYNTYNAGVNFVNVDTSQSWSGRTTKITCGVTTTLRQRGPGELNIDLQATSPAVIIERTKANTNGSIATNIWGTAVASLLVNGDASVGFAAYGNVASACPLITLNGATARLVVGKNVTATTVHIENGTALINCGGTTINTIMGKVQTDAGTTWTNWNQYDAQVVCNGIATTLNLKGTDAGRFDTTQSQVPRVIGTITGAGHIYRNSAVVTYGLDSRVNKSGEHESATEASTPVA